MASILHNPKQVIDQSLLKELAREVDSTSLKPLSRAESYQRHSLGGQINFLNFKLFQAHSKVQKDQTSLQKEHERMREQQRINNARLPRINQSAAEFLKEKVKSQERDLQLNLTEPQYSRNQQNQHDTAQGLLRLRTKESNAARKSIELLSKDRFLRQEPPHKNKKSPVVHVDANQLAALTQSQERPQYGSLNIRDAIFAKRANLLQKLQPLPAKRDSGSNHVGLSRNFLSVRGPYESLIHPSDVNESVHAQSTHDSPNRRSHSKTRSYIQSLTKDVTLKKNESSNLRMSYNPLLEDLFEQQEREAELEAAAIKHKKEVSENLRNLEQEFQKKQREKRFQTVRPEDTPNKVSIMQSSLSRDQVESLENRHRAELKGPGTYNPHFMFGKKQTSGVTIPREARKLMPVLPRPVHTLQSAPSQESLQSDGNPASELPLQSSITPMSHFRTSSRRARVLDTKKNSISEVTSQHKQRESKVSTRMSKPPLLSINEGAKKMQIRHNSAATINCVDEESGSKRGSRIANKGAELTTVKVVDKLAQADGARGDASKPKFQRLNKQLQPYIDMDAQAKNFKQLKNKTLARKSSVTIHIND